MRQAVAAPGVRWGTNPTGGTGERYGGRTHVVLPRDVLPHDATGGSNGIGPVAECGLPVVTVRERRPARAPRLCPECCLAAVAVLFPPSTEDIR